MLENPPILASPQRDSKLVLAVIICRKREKANQLNRKDSLLQAQTNLLDNIGF